MQQEWKPSKIGNSELDRAIIGKKVAISDTEEISDTLKHCMALIGVRAANLPTIEEKTFLIEFIKRNFGGHTCEEIKLAFEMAASGRLEVDSRHFENFSCEYVGRILTAYRGWAKNVYVPKKEEVKELPPTQTDWGKVWADYKERAKTQDIYGMIIILPVIDWLELNGYFDHLTADDERKLIAKAQYDLSQELKPFQRVTQNQVYIYAKTLAAKNLLRNFK